MDTYGEDAISYRTCKTWFAKFKKGDFSLEDALRSGRPMELDLEVLGPIVEEDSYLTIREMATMLGYKQSTIVREMEMLGKVAKLGRWVPHELYAYDLLKRVDTCTSLFTFQKKLHFLNSMIIGDEKWVLYYNPGKRQWVDRGEQSEAISKADLYANKVLLSFW